MSRRPPKQKPMTNFLRPVIRASGKNRSFFYREARINNYRFMRFMKGKGTLRLTSADRLVNALNLKVRARVKAPHK